MAVSDATPAEQREDNKAVPVIEMTGVTVALGDRDILRELDLALWERDKLMISGESGSGKSTLLKTLIGEHRPLRGDIAFDGKPLKAATLAAVRSRMCYLPQDIQFLGDETCRDFLAAPFSLAVNRQARFEPQRARELFDALGLKSHLMESRVRDLSGGERKRLGVVLALLLGRPLLLMDEPTSAVDEENRLRMLEVILEMPDTTVLAVTHDAELLSRATRRAALRDGRIEEAG
jgi:putative ABC transport system ATP-binding protein